MAPKAAKPPPKWKAAEDIQKLEEPKPSVEYVPLQDINPLKRMSLQNCYTWLLLTSFISIGTIVVAMKFYLDIKSFDDKDTDMGLRKVGRSMAIGILKPYLIYGYQKEMAKEFAKLEQYLIDRDEVVRQEKIKYKTFFEGPKEKMGWESFDKTFYYISKELKTWYDAENFCMSRGSHLTSILTTKEQKYITMQFTEPFWIGLSDENMEGDWKWTDGSSLVTEYWAPQNSSLSDSANTMEQDCVFIDPLVKRHNWEKDDCFTLKRWICKELIKIK